MMSQPDVLRPPRIAAWLLSLFTPAGDAESLTGDLLEEFSGIATKSGLAVARAWYWRQALNSIVHLTATAFRTAPWSMLIAVAGGFWLTGFATRISEHAMRSFLDSQRLYELHPDAYLFWLTFPLLIGRVILCALIGGFVALAARTRGMPAVVVLAVVEMALFVAGAVAVIASGHAWLNWFLDMLPWNCFCAAAMIAGGAIVSSRRRRPAIVPG